MDIAGESTTVRQFIVQEVRLRFNCPSRRLIWFENHSHLRSIQGREQTHDTAALRFDLQTLSISVTAILPRAPLSMQGHGKTVLTGEVGLQVIGVGEDRPSWMGLEDFTRSVLFERRGVHRTRGGVGHKMVGVCYMRAGRPKCRSSSGSVSVSSI